MVVMAETLQREKEMILSSLSYFYNLFLKAIADVSYLSITF